MVEYRGRGGAGVQEVGEGRVWGGLVGEVGGGTLGRVLGGGGGARGEEEGGVEVWRVESASSAGQDRDDEILAKIPLPGAGRGKAVAGAGAGDMDVDQDGAGAGGGAAGDGAGADSDDSEDQTLHLLPIDLKRTFPPNATGRERSLAAQDRSWYLNHLISTHLLPSSSPSPPSPTSPHPLDPGSRELLAELELTFIHALTLSNFSSAEAYTRTLALCLTCEARVLTHTGFYDRLMELLVVQLGVGLDCFAPPGEPGEDAGAVAGAGAGGVEDGEGEGEEAGMNGTAWAPDWLTEGGYPVPRLLRGFLRTLKRLLSETSEPGVEGGQGGEREREKIEGLLGRFGELERVVEGRLGWVVDAGKVVKRGMVMLEDGEMVELEMKGLLDEEEEEEGEGPVVVEL